MIAKITGLIWQKSVIDALLAALDARAAAALLTTPTVGLYIDNHVPNPLTDTVASFTQPGWTGYAPAVCGTLTGPVNLDTQNGRALVADADFIATAEGTGWSQAQGIFLFDGATALYAQSPFESPINIASAGDAVLLDVLIQLAFRQGF